MLSTASLVVGEDHSASVDIVPIVSTGTSVSWSKRQKKALERWEAWRKLDKRFAKYVPWNEMREEELRNRDLYESFLGIHLGMYTPHLGFMHAVLQHPFRSRLFIESLQNSHWCNRGSRNDR